MIIDNFMILKSTKMTNLYSFFHQYSIILFIMKNFTKNYYLLLIFFLSCSGGSDSPTEIVNDIDPEPDKITDSFKKILSDEYNTETFKFGATLNYYQFNSNVEDLFLKEFDYLVLKIHLNKQ